VGIANREFGHFIGKPHKVGGVPRQDSHKAVLNEVAKWTLTGLSDGGAKRWTHDYVTIVHQEWVTDEDRIDEPTIQRVDVNDAVVLEAEREIVEKT
jgi:hypothetical protein